MFSVNHLIWAVICLILIISCIILINKFRPSLKLIETIAICICFISELTKVFSTMKMVQGTDGTYHPYLELNQLPLHLCSFQIIFITICRFSKNEKIKHSLYAFMYPSCILGAIIALALPSIFSTTISVSEAFTSPIAYQFFLYHTMLIIYGYSVFKYKLKEFKVSDCFKTIGILIALAFVSLYLNSVFASPVYENGVLKSVEFTTNFFFTYKPPINISLTTIEEWYLYILVILLLAVILITVMYIPVFINSKKNATAKINSENKS